MKNLQQKFLLVLCVFGMLSISPIYGVNASFEETLKEIDRQAKLSNSDEVLILQDGKTIYSYSSKRILDPILTMSASKSIVALAIGLAIDEKFIKTENELVSTFFSEWKAGEKSKISIKNLLNHTSGLESDKTTEKLYANADFIKFALDSKLANPPGSRFFYNNNATNILPGIIKESTRIRMDNFLDSRLFSKLSIRREDWKWTLDKVGNPYGMSGLQIRPEAFAKIGQLILQNGKWENKQIISQSWLNKMLTPSQDFEKGCGFLWWLKPDSERISIFFGEELIKKYEAAGLPINSVKQLEKIKNQRFSRKNLLEKLSELFPDKAKIQSFFDQARLKGLPDGEIDAGTTKAYVAEGYLGQYLVIIPEKKIVGVRLLHYTSAKDNTQFQSFTNLLFKL